jgi:hypothetical protein
MILSEMPDTNISHQKIFCCLVAWVGSSYWQHGDHNEQNHAWKSSQQMLYWPRHLKGEYLQHNAGTITQVQSDNLLGLKHQQGEFQLI